MYANIRGVRGKRAALIEILESEKPEFFLLTETLLPPGMNLQIEKYVFFGKSRIGQKGGGVGILVRNELKTTMTVDHFFLKFL